MLFIALIWLHSIIYNPNNLIPKPMKNSSLLFITAAMITSSLSAQAPKRVIVEDLTGTWCGYCPRGKTVLEDCMTTYPGTIGMEVHNGDTYKTAYSLAIDAGLTPSGYPNGSIDRFAFGGATPCFGTTAWKSKVATRLNTSTPVAVGITSTYNSSTRALSVTVKASFLAAASGAMNISCVLTEDNVVTPSDPQHNYMNATVGDPWYGMGSTIPNYEHDGVARLNLASDHWGTANVIPASVSAGATYSQTYNYTVPATWNASNVYIVAFVNKAGTTSTTREIMNANRVVIGSSTVDVAENKAIDQLQIKNAFPNPFSEMTAIQFQLNATDNVTLNVYNSTGQLVNTLVNTKLAPGEHTFYWAGNSTGGDAVAPGLYRYVITTSSNQVSKSVMYAGN